jgi:hypothetical protein
MKIGPLVHGIFSQKPEIGAMVLVSRNVRSEGKDGLDYDIEITRRTLCLDLLDSILGSIPETR